MNDETAGMIEKKADTIMSTTESVGDLGPQEGKDIAQMPAVPVGPEEVARMVQWMREHDRCIPEIYSNKESIDFAKALTNKDLK